MPRSVPRSRAARSMAAGALLALSAGCGGGGPAAPAPHVVALGSVSEEAVAVGRVEPRVQVPVASTWGGVVKERFVELGARVKRGDPLLEVRPQLTDQDRLRAQRSLRGAMDGYEAAREMSDGENVMGKAMRFFQGAPSIDRMREGAERSRTDAELQLQLLLDGRAEHDGLVLDWVVRAPIDGAVVQLPVEQGQPVVPASNFGPGTPLVTIADIDAPVFRGTVDELDAGRLAPGMVARLDLGALPGVAVEGKLREISLLAGERAGATVFDVVLDVVPPEGVVLRAGYSAVARIAVHSATDVPVLPERLVDYRSDGAFVRVPGADGAPVWKAIETGASDGLTVEITSGLSAGDAVLEPAR
ncbi:MAG: HlyD family efflux transporter periplasmic adaptor subunit [Planctomycetota bacterium]